MDTSKAIELLSRIEGGESPDTDTALSDAISVYREMKGLEAEAKAIQERAKTVVHEIMQETGLVKAETAAGTASYNAPGTRVYWDGGALDALCASNPKLAALLGPHRTEKPSGGNLVIR